MSATVYETTIPDATNTELVQIKSFRKDLSVEFPVGSGNKIVCNLSNDGVVAVPLSVANFLKSMFGAADVVSQVTKLEAGSYTVDPASVASHVTGGVSLSTTLEESDVDVVGLNPVIIVDDMATVIALLDKFPSPGDPCLRVSAVTAVGAVDGNGDTTLTLGFKEPGGTGSATSLKVILTGTLATALKAALILAGL